MLSRPRRVHRISRFLRYRRATPGMCHRHVGGSRLLFITKPAVAIARLEHSDLRTDDIRLMRPTVREPYQRMKDANENLDEHAWHPERRLRTESLRVRPGRARSLCQPAHQ